MTIKLHPTHALCCPWHKAAADTLRTIWLVLGNHTLEDADWNRIREAAGSAAYQPPAAGAYKLAAAVLDEEVID